MIRWLKKWLKVPESNETKLVESVQLWEVRWESRYGEYSTDTKHELECFFSEEEAEHFATALRNAFALVKMKTGNKVVVEKAK